jgi:outer membrane protein OmpA-like peptidoglycan-associated protein
MEVSVRLGTAVLVSVFLCFPQPLLAQVQEVTTFPIERLRPSLDRDSILGVEWAGLPEVESYDLGLWFSYASDPLIVIEDNNGVSTVLGSLVESRMALDLTFAIGLLEELQVGLELPVIASNSRGDLDTEQLTLIDLDTAGMGDVRIMPKFGILRDDSDGINLAMMVTTILPTSSGESYMGEGGFAVEPTLLVSHDFEPVRVAAEIGLHFRPVSEFLDLVVGNEFFWAVGAGYYFGTSRERELEIDISLNQARGVASSPPADAAAAAEELLPTANQNTLELRLGGAYDIPDTDIQTILGVGRGFVAGYGSPDWRFFLAIRYSPRVYDRDRDGILDHLDDCPDDPEDRDGFEDSDGCPDVDNDEDGILDVDDSCPDDPEDFDDFEDEEGCPDPDNDQDGILDAVDECPNDPEDFDGWQDEDGCPDPDNDFDTILDPVDDCPLEPETWNNFEDEDGCPDEGVIEVTCAEITIADAVYFDTDSDVIQQRSYDLLDNVSGVMVVRDDLLLIRIEGHTDSRASDEHNLDLSDRRANSVMTYMIERGVAPDRLIARGFGESQPIADNETAEGRAANRRVVFAIIEQLGCEDEAMDEPATDDSGEIEWETDAPASDD